MLTFFTENKTNDAVGGGTIVVAIDAMDGVYEHYGRGGKRDVRTSERGKGGQKYSPLFQPAFAAAIELRKDATGQE